MPPFDQSALSDARILHLAQQGHPQAGAALPRRLGGLRDSDSSPSDGPLLDLARLQCKAKGLRGMAVVEEVVAATYAALFDPGKARFDPNRGTLTAYLRGLVMNAVRDAMPRNTTGYPGDCVAPPSGMSLEDRECVCWAYQTAPASVRRAFGRMRHGRTRSEVATALGISRRTLNREIECHLDACRRMLVPA